MGVYYQKGCSICYRVRYSFCLFMNECTLYNGLAVIYFPKFTKFNFICNFAINFLRVLSFVEKESQPNEKYLYGNLVRHSEAKKMNMKNKNKAPLPHATENTHSLHKTECGDEFSHFFKTLFYTTTRHIFPLIHSSHYFVYSNQKKISQHLEKHPRTHCIHKEYIQQCKTNSSSNKI